MAALLARLKAHSPRGGRGSEERRCPTSSWRNLAAPAEAGTRSTRLLNLDTGSGRIRGISAMDNVAAAEIFRAWLAPFADLGATAVSLRGGAGTDHASFDGVGVPAFGFIQDGLEYMSRTWHSDLDTLERASREDLMQAATVMASFLYHAAMRDNVPRKPPGAPAKAN